MGMEEKMLAKIMLLEKRGYNVKIIGPVHVEIWKGDSILGDTERRPDVVANHFNFKRELSDPTYFPMRKRFMNDMEELGIPHLADGSKKSMEILCEFIDKCFKEKILDDFGVTGNNILPVTLMNPSRQ